MLRRKLYGGPPGDALGNPPIALGDHVLLEYTVRPASGGRALAERCDVTHTVGEEAPGFMPASCARAMFLGGLRHGDRVIVKVDAGRLNREAMDDPPWVVEGVEWIDDAFVWEMRARLVAGATTPAAAKLQASGATSATSGAFLGTSSASYTHTEKMLPPLRLPTMRVLVIGGTQFMGRLTVEALLDAGHHVTIISRGVSDNPFLENPNVVAHRCDRVAERDHFRRILESSSVGWDVAIDFICFQPLILRDTLEALWRPGGGFRVGHYIFVSTQSVYWSLKLPPGSVPITEEDGLRFPPQEWEQHRLWCELTEHGRHQLAYGSAKLDAEDLLRELGGGRGLAYTILRLPDIFGPYDNIGAFWQLAMATECGQRVDLGIPQGRFRPGRELQEGELRFRLASAGDVRNFILLVIDAGSKVHGEVLHVVGDEETSLRGLVGVLADALGAPVLPPLLAAGEALYPSTDFGLLDGTKARRLLPGWRPTPLRKAVREAVVWHRRSDENRRYAEVCARAREASVQRPPQREPWNPLDFSREALRLFNAEIRSIAADLRLDPSPVAAEMGRSALRVINLATGAPNNTVATQRRALMEHECVGPLHAAGVDAGFFEGCVGMHLPLDIELLLRGGLQEVSWGGSTYEIDTRLFIGRGNATALRVMEARFREMDFFPLFWHALERNHQEPQTPGFVGGYISHAEVWKDAWRRGLDWTFVAEDDCIPNGSIAEGRSKLSWLDVWRVAAAQVCELRSAGIPWDILYIGRAPSQSRPGPPIPRIPYCRHTAPATPTLVAPGWCMRTQSYCLSRSGITKLCTSGMANRVLHRPQDELLAALSMGGHPQTELWQRLLEDGPQDWRALALRFDGITCQLQDTEKSERALSFCACSDGISGVSANHALNPGLLEE